MVCMDNEQITDIYFINNYFTKNAKINYYKLKTITDDEINYLLNRFEYVESINESLFRIKHNINIRPKCKICGNNVKFYGKIKRIYSDCCCDKCANIYLQQNIKKNSLEKYGVEHPAKRPENIQKHKEYYHKNNIKDKLHQAVIDKYGVDNVFQLQEVKDKIKNTSIEKYGTKYPNQSDIVKDNIKKSNNEKYGVDYGFQSFEIKEKIKQTCLEKYKVDNPAKSKFVQNKIKKTNLIRYGVKCPLNNETIKYKNISKEECINKQLNSLILNGTANSSKPELESFELLKQKFPDVIHHYKDNIRYPFNCDFYIPSLDLFIECQYGMFHNGRPYLNTNEDQYEIQLLKEKSKIRKQKTGKKKTKYDAVIDIWSIKDTYKRNIAKENNLNYLEFWNIQELKTWINKYETK